MRLITRNWTDFQHYKDRAPQWIKLHKGLLDNYEYHCLPLASKALAPMLWLLASEYEDGIIDAAVGKIAFRLSVSVEELEAALNPLIEQGFFSLEQPASSTLAECLPRERERDRERDREEKEEKEKGAADAGPSVPAASPDPRPVQQPAEAASERVADPSPPKGKGKGSAKAGAADGLRRLTVADLVAEGVEQQHATDWFVARGKIPLTVTAWAATKREAAKAGVTPAQAVKHAAERGWRGFMASYVQPGSGYPQAAKPSGKHAGFDGKEYGDAGVL